MKYYVLLLSLIFSVALSANPTYYPLTSIAEGFYSTGCVSCLDGLAGMDILDNSAHNGEFINIRHYINSGPLSNPQSDARFDHYQVFGTPSFILNGKTRIDGGGAEIADGSEYLNAYQSYRFGDSPLKLQLSSWNAATGQLSGTIEMISPTLNIVNQKKYYALVENNVSTEATHIVRDLAFETISLSGVGAINNFSHTFTINPAWNQSNLWVAVFVQLDNDAILQSVSSLATPDFNLRAAMDWERRIVVAGNINYTSSPFWLYNLGATQDCTMQIVVDSAPANWYFNYCDEEGYCYPGSVPLPVSYNSGDAKAYHLNIQTGASGIALFKFVFTNANGTYEVPFKMLTDDVSASDPLLSPAALTLLSARPNPFSSELKLSLESTKAMAAATLEIFNLKGQRVDSITRQSIQTGTTELSWIPSAQLPSGVYFLKLQGSSERPLKVLLVK